MQTRTLLSMTCAIAFLAACEEGVYDGFDRRPAATQGSAPAADSRGVIVYDTYQVIEARSGDTMDTIAGRIGMTAAALAEYNGLNENYTPRPKEIFAIPPGVVTGADGQIETSELDDGSGEAPFGTSNEGQNAVRHTVEEGETAYTIARLYNVSVTSLASWNNLDRDLTVRVGQQLLIPQASSQAAAPPAPAPAPQQPKPETTETAAAATNEAAETPPPAPPAQKTAKMAMPVQGKIIRDYDDKQGGNDGIDIQADAGAAVVAADAGTVSRVEDSVVEGTKIVIIRHADNILTVYVNVTGPQVSSGDQVRRGQTIGSVAPGDPPYLGFRIYKGTQSQDPAPYLN